MKEVSFGKLLRVSKLANAEVIVKPDFGFKNTDVFKKRVGVVLQGGFLYYVDTVEQQDVLHGRWVTSLRYRVVRKTV